ncbi:hypothetical protein ACFTRD_27700 [Paenibacillus sp. NPDC056933]|uniref:hypothetical protein n=1 Tax=Paenibacillus sp. NPDC056933 TaxID=3345968 RepID=UPI003641D297
MVANHRGLFGNRRTIRKTIGKGRKSFGTEDASVGTKDTPERVVAVTLRTMAKGKQYVVPGLRNYLGAQISRFMTRRQSLRLVGGMLRPRKQY